MTRWSPLALMGVALAATIGFAAGCLMLAVDVMLDAWAGRKMARRTVLFPADWVDE